MSENNDNQVNKVNQENHEIQDVAYTNASIENKEPNDSINKNMVNNTGLNPNANFNQDGQSGYNINNKTNYKKSKGKGRVISYIAVALASSIIGGTVLAGMTLYVLPTTPIFKSTPLYKSIAQNYNAKGIANSNPSPTIINPASVNGLTITDVVKKVAPAVVGVSTYQGSNLIGTGTGIIFTEDGYIVTNNHVIASGNTFKIMLSTNKEVTAKLVNYDSKLDVAVLKINESVQMPGIATFGDSDSLQVGETAIAIGNPLGAELSNSVTSGIISAVDRKIPVENTTQTYLQTDAAINEGNSGGPLINGLGQVIGINAAKIGGSGVEGLGFAIPINVVKERVKDLIKPMLMLGISAETSTTPAGVKVDEVTTASAAAKAGIKTNDIITKFDDQSVKNVDELNTLKAKHKAGDVIKVEVYRNSAYVNLSITLIAAQN